MGKSKNRFSSDTVLVTANHAAHFAVGLRKIADEFDRLALSQVIKRIELRFEQSKRDQRKWVPVGGTIVFSTTDQWATSWVVDQRSVVPKKATISRKDFDSP